MWPNISTDFLQMKGMGQKIYFEKSEKSYNCKNNVCPQVNYFYNNYYYYYLIIRLKNDEQK